MEATRVEAAGHAREWQRRAQEGLLRATLVIEVAGVPVLRSVMDREIGLTLILQANREGAAELGKRPRGRASSMTIFTFAPA